MIILLFLVLPVSVSFFLVFWWNIFLSQAILSSLTTVMSVFIGFSVNVIVIMLRINIEEETWLRKKLFEHLYYNTLYELVLGISILSLTLFLELVFPIRLAVMLIGFSLLLYFLVVNFLLMLLQIARRLYYLLRKKLEPLKE